MSFKGVNYGKLDIEGDALRLTSMNGAQSIFNISYASINNSVMNKNDIIIETASEEVGNDDCICEIRFHVEDPKHESEEEMDDENKEQNVEKEHKVTYAQQIYQKVVEKAKIGEFAGESIATLIDVNLAVPRGKYTIDFYQKNLRFHGMTFNYNVDYKNITKGFILPMMNEAQVSIVLQLNKDRPIYQGQTIYRYIVIQIKKEIEVEIKTKLNPEIIEKAPIFKELKPQYSGPLFQVFTDLLNAAAEVTLITPGNHFKSKSGQSCIKCNVKAQAGWLYILKQSLIFIPKPVLYFKCEEIGYVDFNRMGATNKQFDMKITLKEDKKTVQFMGIERPEFDALVEYFKTRNVKVNLEQEPSKIIPDAEDDQSQDEDFEAGEDDSDEDASQSHSAEVGSEEESDSNKKEKHKKVKDEKKDSN